MYGAWLGLDALHLAPARRGKNLRLMRGFRAAILGAAIASAALGWWLQVEGLVIAAAIIGLGELFETSLNVWALRGS